MRPVFRIKRKLRGKNPLLDAFEEIANDSRFKRGRENIVLILAYGKDSYGNTLGALLNDTDVYGHALFSLNKAKVGGYENEVKKILDTEKIGWIKAAARKYLKNSEEWVQQSDPARQKRTGD